MEASEITVFEKLLKLADWETKLATLKTNYDAILKCDDELKKQTASVLAAAAIDSLLSPEEVAALETSYGANPKDLCTHTKAKINEKMTAQNAITEEKKDLKTAIAEMNLTALKTTQVPLTHGSRDQSNAENAEDGYMVAAYLTYVTSNANADSKKRWTIILGDFQVLYDTERPGSSHIVSNPFFVTTIAGLKKKIFYRGRRE